MGPSWKTDIDAPPVAATPSIWRARPEDRTIAAGRDHCPGHTQEMQPNRASHGVFLRTSPAGDTVQGLAECPVIPFLWLGCSDYHLNEQPGVKSAPGVAPEIVVTPPLIEFAPLGVLDAATKTETITITNSGQATLELRDVWLTGDLDAFSIAPFAVDALGPGRITTLDVTFHPAHGIATWSIVGIESNDPTYPLVEVELRGEGLAPDLRVTPSVLDLGTVLPGCTTEHEIAIENVGSDELTITGVTLGNASPALTWGPVNPSVPFPWVIQPDARIVSHAFYAPDVEGVEHAQLQVASNDPEKPVATADIDGFAGTGSVEDVYDQPEVPAADILFVIDDSSSMSDEQSSLASYGSQLVSKLDESATNWQIAVITTTSPALRGPVLTPDTVHLVDDFETQIMPGTGGDHNEMGIEMAYNALHAQAGPGSPFFRDDAKLIVVFISDEEDQSTLVDPADAATYFQNIKDPGKVLAHSVTALTGDGCTVESYGTRYAELTSMVGGLRMSICSNWSTIVDDLADSAVFQLDRFGLTRTPVVDTIEVEVDGHPAPMWTYDEKTNEVVFDEEAIPEGGAVVTITYEIGGCDP
jgi:hypothetical protein